MRNHRVTALSVCLVILASVFAAACTEPSYRPASNANDARSERRTDR